MWAYFGYITERLKIRDGKKKSKVEMKGAYLWRAVEIYTDKNYFHTFLKPSVRKPEKNPLSSYQSWQSDQIKPF